jgi:glycosyltransferase involved in cell wall biosynthesis
MLVENLSVPADPRVWREARALCQAGFQVCIISPRGDGRDQEAYTRIDGIHIYRYKIATAINSCSNYIKEYATVLLMTFWLSLVVWFCHDFDVIHAANPPDIFFALGLFYRLFGKKYIFDQHDLAPEMFHIKFKNRMKPLYLLLSFLERCSYRAAHLVITTNESQKCNAIERGHCPAHKVVVVRNGPDITRRISVEQKPALQKNRRYLLAYLGVISVQDGVEYALYTLDELVHRHGRHDVALVLMGDGDQLPALKRLAYNLHLEEYVHFTGWVASEDMLHYLSAADIGLSPDPSNELNDRSTMLKTMEYMAMGKPVVAW